MSDQTKRDSDRAASRTYKSGGTKDVQDKISTGRIETSKPSTMAAREAAAGLNLAGNDPMSGRGGKTPTMAEREAAAGLNLAGNDTMSGRHDMGAPREPRTVNATEGNIESDFDDFSPENPATPAQGNIHAFQLVSGGDALYVRQGTVGSTIPTITGGSELAAEYTDNELSIPGTGTREYWIKVTLNASSVITAVTIETSEPSADSATQAKLLLGSVETNSGDIVAFNSNLSGSQSLASCGSTHYFGLV